MLRLWRRQMDARAVRKAVRVAAWRKPRGQPVLEKRVMAPVGLVVSAGPDVGLSVSEVSGVCFFLLSGPRRVTTVQGM